MVHALRGFKFLPQYRRLLLRQRDNLSPGRRKLHKTQLQMLTLAT
jgi:hypothetical protein